jgi:Na+-driven multidrug efflux pump
VTVLTSLALARARAFTTDAAVLAQIQAMAPPMLIATMLACVNTVVDGSLLALKDFKFLTTISTVTALLQLPALAVVAASGLGAPAVFATFALRLAVFGLAGAARLRYSAGLL